MKPTIIKNILFKLQGQVIGTYSGDEMSHTDIEKLADVMAEECEVCRDEIEVEVVNRYYPDELSKTFVDVIGDLVNFDKTPMSVNKVSTIYDVNTSFMLEILLTNPDEFLFFSN